MTENEARERMKYLYAEIDRHIYLYYNQDEPEITDAEFDVLYRDLQNIEKQYPEFAMADSPTKKVGAKPSGGFKKVSRKVAMLSLENAMNKDEYIEFDQRIRKLLGESKSPQVVAELKMDGLSLDIDYERGILVRASTRGDSTTGEDVTANVSYIRDIPRKLKGAEHLQHISIRGEVYMKLDVFRKLNAQLQEAGDKPYSNPRNAAAGALRQIHPEETGKRDLSFFAYAMGDADEDFEPLSQVEFLQTIEGWGLPVNRLYRVIDDVEGVLNYFDDINAKRESLEYDIDGLVLKCNQYSIQKELGVKSKTPRHSIALKFPPRQAVTRVEEIALQLGRTGVITPVCKVAKIECSGVMVSSATLHNFAELAKKDIRISDFVVIERRGEVIPAVIKSLTERRDGSERIVTIPEVCPVCGGKVGQIPGEVAIRCLNGVSCPAQVFGAIIHAIGRNGLDIQGMGDQYVQGLLDKRIVKTVADLFYLTQQDLIQLDRMGNKVASKLMAALDKSRTCELPKFIFSLGIAQVGEGGAKRLAHTFGTFENIKNATMEQLLAVKDVGETTATSVYTFFRTPANMAIIDRMFAAGVAPKASEVKSENDSGKFTGLTFVFTGAMSKPRPEMEAIAESLGGKASGSVSKKTSHLVIGENAGAVKTSKAREAGVKVLTEVEFLDMVES